MTDKALEIINNMSVGKKNYETKKALKLGFKTLEDYVRDKMDTWDDTTESLYYHIIKDQGMNVDTYIKLKQSKRKNK